MLNCLDPASFDLFIAVTGMGVEVFGETVLLTASDGVVQVWKLVVGSAGPEMCFQPPDVA